MGNARGKKFANPEEAAAWLVSAAYTQIIGFTVTPEGTILVVYVP